VENDFADLFLTGEAHVLVRSDVCLASRTLPPHSPPPHTSLLVFENIKMENI